MGLQLVANDVVAPLRVPVGAVHNVNQDSRPLDVAQERVAQAGTGTRALDQARNVGDRRAARLLIRGVEDVAQVQDAEVGLERGERIVGDLGPGRGQRGKQRGLARVGKPHQTYVGDQPQLQADPALLPGFALLGVARSLMRGRGEVDVAQTALAAPRHHQGLFRGDEIAQKPAGLVLEDARARRHLESHVAAGLAVHSGAGTATAGRGLEVMGAAVVAQTRLARVDGQID